MDPITAGRPTHDPKRPKRPQYTKSEKAQTGIEKTAETTIRRRSHTHIGLRSHAKHRFVFHRRGHHMMAFHMPGHRFVIHRHGRRFVALNELGAA